MFRKIEIWILYLAILLSIPFAIGFGVLVRQELVGETKLGKISKAAVFLAEVPTNLRKIYQRISGVEVTLQDRFPNINGFVGTPNVEESYLLLSKYDGNLREGVVELVDLRNFKVLHTWNPDIDKFNSLVNKVGEFKNLERDMNNARETLQHPLLTSDGELIFQPFRKIDECSNLISQNVDNVNMIPFHHSMEKDIDGNFWLPSRIYPQSLPSEKVGRVISDDKGFIDDSIIKLSPNREILFEKSISQILIDNDLEYLLFSTGDNRFTHDPIHLNDIQPVNFDSKYWKKGDVFISIRHQSMVFLYRPSTNKIIWKGTGPFFHQHDVDILNDHRISVFNNNSKDFVTGNVVDGHNEVIIYDFKENKYTSYLAESLKKNGVRTITAGRSEILPNGDLLIEETNYARTLYFNSDGTLKWSHVNRANDGKVYIVEWSRILHSQSDILNVNNFLNTRIECND